MQLFLPATHVCCIGLYLSPPSPLIGYSCVSSDFRLQKQSSGGGVKLPTHCPLV